MITTYIYVYKLNNGCYYVGRTSQPHKRYSQHESGKGAAWVRYHGAPVLVECNRKVVENDSAADAAENIKTLQLMQRYGWEKVRGGWFCHIDETQTKKALRHHGVLELLIGPSTSSDS